MSRSPKQDRSTEPQVGLRIENHVIQVAIATPTEQGTHDVGIDSETCQRNGGWLCAAGRQELTSALRQLIERNDLKHATFAASLDGDFCVTRVSTGKPDDVDGELKSLAGRIPRYLQLGPGDKVIGSSRMRLEPAVDYAVTGVANRNIVELLYETFRACEIEVRWMEPSLVSLARLAGQAKLGNSAPILIADGTGKQWDVGIAHEGRLLLDYRPAAARTKEAFRDALIGHISRLRRFCQRHRRLDSGELNNLYICSGDAQSDAAATDFEGAIDVKPSALRVPKLESLYRIDESFRHSGCAPAVATVLPLMIGVEADAVPDLLDNVRRAPDLSTTARIFRTFWPACAAAVLLIVGFAGITHKRYSAQSVEQNRNAIQNEMRSTQVRMSALADRRQLIDYLSFIGTATRETAWETLYVQVTQCLSDETRLNSFRVESNGAVRLDGIVTDESMVYDLVASLRRLTPVRQVALKATNPESNGGGARFLIELMMMMQESQHETNKPQS